MKCFYLTYIINHLFMVLYLYIISHKALNKLNYICFDFCKLKYKYIYLRFLHSSLCVCVCAMRRSEDSLQESVLLLHLLGFRDWDQTNSGCWEATSQLSHFTSPLNWSLISYYENALICVPLFILVWIYTSNKICNIAVYHVYLKIWDTLVTHIKY